MDQLETIAVGADGIGAAWPTGGDAGNPAKQRDQWPADQRGGYPTESLGSNAGSAYWGISQFYQDLNQAYDMVIGYMRQFLRQ